MYLGLDIGTSSVKSVIIDESGLVVADSSAPLGISRPHPNWSEQDPEDWWSASSAAVLGLDARLRANVCAIGLSGQMHGATLLNSDHKVLRPAILWNDGRSTTECDELQTQEPDYIKRGANLVMPGFTAPKLAWVRRHEPDIFSQIGMVLLPKDYVRLRMTGECASDMSDSAGTLWMDVENRRWHDPLLAACGLHQGQMPTLYEGHEVTGRLSTHIARAWAMSPVPVIAGGGDNAAGAVGAGVVADNDALMSLGTSGVIFVASEKYKAAPDSAVHAFCHALPHKWHMMSVMLSAASCLEWACKATHTESVGRLVELAETTSNRSGREMFLPYLSGERTPHNNTQSTGVLFGLDHNSGPAEIANAVLEGVAFGMADGLDALIGAGARVESLSVIGGGSQSPYWGDLLATALGKPLVYREGAAVGPAFGAARLAHYGVGGGNEAEVFCPPKITHIIEPDASLADAVGEKRQKFVKLYQALKPNFADN